MNRRKIPDWLILPLVLGLGVLFFVVGYWPDRSVTEGALGVFAGITSWAFWSFMEAVYHSGESRSEEERKNNFGLL